MVKTTSETRALRPLISFVAGVTLSVIMFVDAAVVIGLFADGLTGVSWLAFLVPPTSYSVLCITFLIFFAQGL